MAFQLDSRLAADTTLVGRLPLSRVLLMNERSFPWCILVPQRIGMREIHELDAADRDQLVREISDVSAAMQNAFDADKMNVAALGNIVPQLHVHIIARFETDPAWPAPVWGRAPAAPCSPAELRQRLTRLRTVFEPLPDFRTR